MLNFHDIQDQFTMTGKETLAEQHARIRANVLVNIQNIPKEMADLDQWVNWVVTEEDSKRKKIPHRLTAGKLRKVSAMNRSNHMTFTDAVQTMVDNDGVTGIGFVLTRDDPYACVDIDSLDKITDATERAKWLRMLESSCIHAPYTYGEISASQQGMHLFVKCSKDDLPSNPNTDCMEVYFDKRFIAITGDLVHGCPATVIEAGSFVRKLLKALRGQEEGKTQNKNKEWDYDRDKSYALTSADKLVIEAGKKDYWFRMLFNNVGWQKHFNKRKDSSQSAADWELMRFTRHFADTLVADGKITPVDKDQIVRIFMASELFRPHKSNSYLASVVNSAWESRWKACSATKKTTKPASVKLVRVNGAKVKQPRNTAPVQPLSEVDSAIINSAMAELKTPKERKRFKSILIDGNWEKFLRYTHVDDASVCVISSLKAGAKALVSEGKLKAYDPEQIKRIFFTSKLYINYDKEITIK